MGTIFHAKSITFMDVLYLRSLLNLQGYFQCHFYSLFSIKLQLLLITDVFFMLSLSPKATAPSTVLSPLKSFMYPSARISERNQYSEVFHLEEIFFGFLHRLI